MTTNGGHLRLLRPEQLRNPRADVRHGDRLRRLIAGMPVVLMARVQNESEIADAVRSDQRPPIHDLRDSSSPCEKRMPSTAVGIDGNVLRTRLLSSPVSYGV